MELPQGHKMRLVMGLWTLLIILSAYYAVRIYSEIKKDNMLGESTTPATISFTGHGEVTATPNIANISFTISKDDKTVKAAQADVAVVEKSALSVLKTKGVADADIKTTDASFNPKYEYKQAICPQPVMAPLSSGVSVSPIYCNPGKQVLAGYTASESITVKVRNTDTVGDIVQALGTTGVSNLNGPDFSIDNPDALQIQARKLAITDAQTKAKELAKDLGVSLGKISSFDESNNPTPIMFSAKNEAMSAVAPVAAPAVITQGQNTISSDVTITYEIK